MDGSWEQGNRNPSAAAVFALLGIGVLYFNAQSFLAIIAIVLSGPSAGYSEVSGGFLEQFVAVIREYSTAIRIALLISQYLFMLLPVVWLIRRWHTQRVWEYVRFSFGSPKEVGLAVLATLAIMPAGTFIANEFTRRLNIPQEFLEAGAAIFTAHSPAELLFLILVVAVTPAICEEVFFRGYAQRTLERSIDWKSVLVVGVVFGLYHMQPLGLITLSILGIVFGFFYYRSRSLGPPMAAHFTNNAVIVVLLFLRPKVGEMDVAYAEQIPLWWVAVSLPVGLATLVLYHRITGDRSGSAVPAA
ncbi:MAG: CPBP family glutamic-type intramembrane protease [Bacteroidota bacterium]